MTIEELEKKLTELDDLRTELNTRIAALKAQREEPPKPPHPRWEPKFGDIYYTTYLVSDAVGCHWKDDSLDKDFDSLGFVFKTKDEAEFDAERLKVLAKMREWAGNYNDGYSLIYDVDKKRVCYTPASERLVFGEMRFTTGADAEECIEAIGADRIKKYYFMIPEEEKTDDER